MASTQNIERALRERFGSEETIITLVEILSFLKSHQNSHYVARNPKIQQPMNGIQQNAPPTQGQARDQTREVRETQQTRKGRATQEPRHKAAAKTQGSQSTAKPPETIEPHGPQSQSKGPETQPQGPQKQPSYAEIAKRASERPKSTSEKPSKPKRKA